MIRYNLNPNRKEDGTAWQIWDENNKRHTVTMITSTVPTATHEEDGVFFVVAVGRLEFKNNTVRIIP